MSLIVIVECSDGTTFEQEIPYQNSVEASIKIFQRYIGQDYWVVDWRLE